MSWLLGRRLAGRLLLAPALGAVLAGVAAGGLATPAAAHTQLAGAQPNGAGATTLTFTFDHGCDTADTTELSVRMPEGAIAATATGQPPGWTAEVTPSRVDWAGPAIDDAQIAAGAAEFSVLVRLTGAVGQTFWFPAVQRCADGSGYDWTGTEPDTERPAPSLVATAAVLTPAAGPGADAGSTSAVGRAADTADGADLPQVLVALAVLVTGAGLVGLRISAASGPG
ncbi:DUF1775 domain-containing protein [Solwaraspora sp. WMMB335]|uniref:DUF1775 domain-containing protein n=1 Tax=Solwaraspora sp. WMMB335 TaxID=3404118 RepID=UPI003B94097B